MFRSCALQTVCVMRSSWGKICLANSCLLPVSIWGARETRELYPLHFGQRPSWYNAGQKAKPLTCKRISKYLTGDVTFSYQERFFFCLNQIVSTLIWNSTSNELENIIRTAFYPKKCHFKEFLSWYLYSSAFSLASCSELQSFVNGCLCL